MTHLVRLRMAFVVLLFCAALSSAPFAAADSDRTQVGRTINVGPDEEIGEATCFGCSIRVRGHVDGDVTAFGGSIVVEDQGHINGDATAFGGDLRLDKAAAISGDVTVFGGRIRRDPAATVGGAVTNFSGMGWMLLIVLLPLAFLGGFLALIVWLVRRLTRPSVPVAA